MNPDPFIIQINDCHRKEILKAFPNLGAIDRVPLTFWKYLDSRPEKFYSERIFSETLAIYSDFLAKHFIDFVDFLKDQTGEINLAYRHLSEINLLDFHDIVLPTDEIELIKLCDYSILPNYLRLLEGVYYVLINSVVAFTQLEKGKSIPNLPLFNRVEIISRSYPEFSNLYYNIIRNGIAHGGVSYGNRDVTFVDDKGNTETFSVTWIIKEFDYLLDFCNAIMLALLHFYYENRSILNSNEFYLPISFLFEELKSELQAPGWEIRGCIESETYNKKSQLNIFAGDSFYDKYRLIHYTIRTIRAAYLLSPRFNRVFQRFFISFSSKKYHRGFISFDGSRIKDLLDSGVDETSAYIQGMDVPLVFHRGLPFRRIFLYGFSLVDGINTIIPFQYKKYQESLNRLDIERRYIDVKQEKFKTFIKVSVIIKNDTPGLEPLIRKEIRSIVRISKQYAKWELPLFSLKRLYPVSFIHINVMLKDFRKRDLKGPGLIPELICTVEQGRKKRKKIVDIMGGVPEVFGNIRLVWNTNSGFPKMKNT